MFVDTRTEPLFGEMGKASVRKKGTTFLDWPWCQTDGSQTNCLVVQSAVAVSLLDQISCSTDTYTLLICACSSQMARLLHKTNLNPKYLVLSSGVFEISTPWALHLPYGVA